MTEAEEAGSDILREKCGVFGIFNHPDAAAITALGLHALQHRGEEAAGIVTFDGARFHSERRLGLVGDAFSGKDVIERLPGDAAVGHVRYSPQARRSCATCSRSSPSSTSAASPSRTTATSQRPDAAPRPHPQGRDLPVDLGHGGVLHLVARSLRRQLHRPVHRRAAAARGRLRFVGLTNKKLIGARDPLGIRPLVLANWTAATSSPPRPARSTSSARASCATSRTARSS